MSNFLNAYRAVSAHEESTSAGIETFLFKLHKWTGLLLFVLSILLGINEFIGAPMYCMTDSDWNDWATDYCFWVQTIFSLPKSVGQTEIDSMAGNPPLLVNAVQNGSGTNYSYEEGSEPNYHAYYIWIPLVLVFQGALFQIPHWMWEAYENNLITNMTKDIVEGNRPGDRIRCLNLEENIKKKINYIASYVKDSMNMPGRGIFNVYNQYALMYITATFLNLINVTGQIVFIDYFLDGMFYDYGIRVLKMIWEEYDWRDDPLTTVFPRVTKCFIPAYGISGTVEYRDVLCILPLNILNEKIYVLLWFWLLLLLMLSVINVGIVLTTIISPSKMLTYGSCLSKTTREYCQHVTHTNYIKYKFGDRFFIYLMSKNIEHEMFKEFLHYMSNEAETRNPNEENPPTFTNEKEVTKSGLRLDANTPKTSELEVPEPFVSSEEGTSTAKKDI